MRLLLSYVAVSLLVACSPAFSVEDARAHPAKELPVRSAVASTSLNQGVGSAAGTAATLPPRGAVITMGGPFTVWERTYICASAEIASDLPASLFPSSPNTDVADLYASGAGDNLAGHFLSSVQEAFRDAGLSQKVLGDTMGNRFTSVAARDPRCRDTPENIFVVVRVGLNQSGKLFSMSYTATQRGRSLTQAIDRDPVAEWQANPRAVLQFRTIIDEIRHEAYRHGAMFATRLIGRDEER